MRHCLLTLFFVTGLAQAQDKVVPAMSDVVLKDHTQVERFQILLTPEISMISRNGQTLRGVGIQGAFVVGIGEKFQAGLGFRQAFSGSSISTLFTAIDLRASYVLTGSNLMTRRQVLINDEPVIQSTSYGQGGLRLDFYVPQYFFNLETSVLPLSGVGGGLHYDFPSSAGFGFQAGFRVDYVTSGGEVTVYPMQVYAGITLWL